MASASRYIIGIDLGTTNSAVAYIDTQHVSDSHVPHIQTFDILQLVAEGEVAAQPTLPSFLYLPSEAELRTGALALPWDKQPTEVVGVFAREQGALVPGRLVDSAKSWLCHAAVDRMARFLPWGAADQVPARSPVEAAASYLAHMREAWNHVFAAPDVHRQSYPFEQQDVVLTVPASFDEEARELTVQAARDAGIEHLTLLEEPQAAFYAWCVAHHGTLTQELADGDLVLICDVGGGTTDFSLIRVDIDDDAVRLERTAIGEHILLGGDNVDLALAHCLEAKLAPAQLTLRQRQALRRQCCAAKERLLNDPALDQVAISVLGSGRTVVGGTMRVELSRDDVLQTLLDGFLPYTEPHDRPEMNRRVGLRELGLPYASDPAVTRHLAHFLQSSGQADRAPGDLAAPWVRSDAILFNGGFFAPDVARERMVDVIAAWCRQRGKPQHWRPKVLETTTPETAVATGAAYYGQVRRVGGLRIHGGSARAYYVGVQTDAPAAETQVQAICVMPRGTEEGTTLDLASRDFTVLTNQPVAFTLYSSITRNDAHGSVVSLDIDEVHRHAPLITILRFGRRSRQVELAVRLTVRFTEVGTLELWCESQSTEHRWRLQFQLRGASQPDEAQASTTEDEQTTQTMIPEAAMADAEQLVRGVFGPSRARETTAVMAPEALIGKLEGALGYGRDAWPLVTIRRLCDTLLEVAEGRKKNKSFEARWLNLFGFCLRPGFSATLDEWRIEQARRIYQVGLVHPNDLDCQLQWLILWRRVAGGLNAGQQLELYQRHLALVGMGGKKRGKKQNAQLEREAWRLLASLERLPISERVALGQALLDKVKAHPKDKSYVWSLGRLGGRIPFAGPLNCVVPADIAEVWLQALLDLPELTADVASAIIQLGARTDDRGRDIRDDLRQTALAQLAQAGFKDNFLQGLRVYVPPASADAARIFGESLPVGLRLAASPA